MKRKKYRSFYDRPVHQRLATRIFEGLLSAGAVYLLSPALLSILAPVQAKINSDAINAGQTPSNVGSNSIANKLITTGLVS